MPSGVLRAVVVPSRRVSAGLAVSRTLPRLPLRPLQALLQRPRRLALGPPPRRALWPTSRTTPSQPRQLRPLRLPPQRRRTHTPASRLTARRPVSRQVTRIMQFRPISGGGTVSDAMIACGNAALRFNQLMCMCLFNRLDSQPQRSLRYACGRLNDLGSGYRRWHRRSPSRRVRSHELEPVVHHWFRGARLCCRLRFRGHGRCHGCVGLLVKTSPAPAG
jgi:hypothetical protein